MFHWANIGELCMTVCYNSCKFSYQFKMLIVFVFLFYCPLYLEGGIFSSTADLYSALITSAGLVAAAFLTWRKMESNTIPLVIRKTNRNNPTGSVV